MHRLWYIHGPIMTNECVIQYTETCYLYQQRKREVKEFPLKTDIIGIDNTMTLNTSMKHSYIAIRYFYITNQLISGDISRVIYRPNEVMKSNYFT